MNDGYIYYERIKPRAAGLRIDTYLSGRYGHSTLAEWREHIGAGRVLVDGSRVQVDTPLRSKQTLEWRRPAWEEPLAPLSFDVIYQDDDVLVVHKPAGLPTMAGGGFLQHTLQHQLQLVVPDASPAHRLGRWTSGAVVCTRNRQAGTSLGKQFLARSLYKRYRALVSGRPSLDRFEIDTPIGPVPYPPLGTLHAASAEGRYALSSVTVVERRETCSLCDVTIATGRPHQIRIHMAAAGHPLVGDPLYGVGGLPLEGGTAVPGDPGYMLHAAEVHFDHPRSGERLMVRVEPPEALGRSDADRP